MLIEAIDQAEKAVETMLSVANRGAAASDFGVGLRRSEGVASKLSAFQTAAVFCVAAIKRHGDCGAQILAGTAGLTRSDARGRVKLDARPGRPALITFREISISTRKA